MPPLFLWFSKIRAKNLALNSEPVSIQNANQRFGLARLQNVAVLMEFLHVKSVK